MPGYPMNAPSIPIDDGAPRSKAASNAREIAHASSTYRGTATAWTLFQDALQPDDKADDLLLRLSMERWRFECWGRVARLEQNDIHDRLVPVAGVIEITLKRLKQTFTDGAQLQSRYGLADDSRPMQRFKSFVGSPLRVSSAKDAKDLEGLLVSMQQCLHGANGYRVSDNFPPADSIVETSSITAAKTNRTTKTNPAKGARWTLRDRGLFIRLVEHVNANISMMSALLPAPLDVSFTEELTRTNILLIGKIENMQTLALVRRAALIGAQDLSLCCLLDRKGISDNLEFNDFSESTLTHRRQTNKSLINLNPSDFYMPQSTSSRRFLTSSRTSQGSIILLERKDQPKNADITDLEKLEARVQRLALLLSNPNSEMSALRCLGYFADPNQSCWWLAFEYPHRSRATSALQIQTRLTPSTRPVSLLRLLCNRSSKWKPALDERLKLSSKLATTLFGLYSSGWMHKSLRSANVLFPYMYNRPLANNSTPDGEEKQKHKHKHKHRHGRPDLEGIEDVSKPLLAGFEYSQQEEESWDGIIYRHPNDQSSASTDGVSRAKPYRLHFDVYSFGLVLVEISLWTPLLDFLDSNSARFSKDDGRHGSLAGNPKAAGDPFLAEDARELQKRVLRVVEKDLGFWMGTEYQKAVRWCLSYADAEQLEGEHEVWHQALEFYNRVVVPLSRLATMGES